MGGAGRALRGPQRVAYNGSVRRLPLPGGAGRAIRSRAETARIPIYVASLRPADLRLTGEPADGWVDDSFLLATAGALEKLGGDTVT